MAREGGDRSWPWERAGLRQALSRPKFCELTQAGEEEEREGSYS